MNVDSEPNSADPILNIPKERTYYRLVLAFAILVWLAIAISLVGIFYAAIFGVVAWLGNGLLTAQLRSEAVRVGPDQLPELNASFGLVCERLGVKNPPALYVLQSGGVLNAFATRFSGRNFVVVFSEMLERFGPDSGEMRFILGHEIGHVSSNHILKRLFLAPGLFFPLLGPAYLRACESSCDRYGAFAAEDIHGSIRAMLALSGGSGQSRVLDPVVFARQHTEERGFFVSLHELTSGYPTLSERVTQLIHIANENPPAPSEPRHPIAYLFALFTPGGRIGGGGSSAMNAMVVIVIIGLLAAMAIPAFQKVRATSQAKVCENNRRMISAAVDQYRLEHSAAPRSFSDITGPGKILPSMPTCPLQGQYGVTFGNNGETQVSCSAKHVASQARGETTP